MRTLSLLAVCLSLSAQYSPPAIFGRVPNLYAATMANMAPLWRQQYVVSMYKGVKPATAASPPPAAAPPRLPADFSFPFQNRWISVDEMAAHLTDSPQERKEVAAQFALLIETVADDLKQDGTPYDVAKAFTFFTATMFSILQPESPLDQAGMNRLLRQFRTDLLDPASLKASPVDRTQRQWESLLGIGGLLLMGHEKALEARNESALRSLRDSAALGLSQLFRVDSRRLQLNPQAALPLSLTSTEPPAPPPAPSSAVTPPPAPAPAPASPTAAAGVIPLGHYHTVSGVHPAEIRLLPDGFSFDPLGHPCNQAALKVPFADVRVASVAVNGNAETLLNLRIRDPKNPNKTLNFNFATRDSWNDASSGLTLVRSPQNALDSLRQLADALRARGAQ